MFAKLKYEKPKLKLNFRIAPALILSVLFLAMAACAQTVSGDAQTTENQTPAQETTSQTGQTPVLMPVWKNYKTVTIGMSAAEVKDKLGKAEIEDKDGFYYEFSDDETAQIALDADKKVRAIIVMYHGGNAPKFEDVMGAESSVEPGKNGVIYKLVRYPKAGYWVAYNHSPGENAMVTVTIQKL